MACEAMIGPLLHSGYGYCTDLNIGKFGMTGAMRASRVAQRRTVSGVPCRLPLVYKCAPLSLIRMFFVDPCSTCEMYCDQPSASQELQPSLCWCTCM